MCVKHENRAYLFFSVEDTDTASERHHVDTCAWHRPRQANIKLSNGYAFVGLHMSLLVVSRESFLRCEQRFVLPYILQLHFCPTSTRTGAGENSPLHFCNHAHCSFDGRSAVGNILSRSSGTNSNVGSLMLNRLSIFQPSN